jgi:hypothetical protein
VGIPAEDVRLIRATEVELEAALVLTRRSDRGAGQEVSASGWLSAQVTFGSSIASPSLPLIGCERSS